MKKLLLILLCLPMIGFGQSYTHKMDSILVYENNVLHRKLEFTYDANNNNILYLSYRDSISILELESKCENTYDINNNLILSKWYDWDYTLSSLRLNSKNEFTYGTLDDLILRENFDWDDITSVWQLKGKSEYTYDVNNNLTMIIHSEFYLQSWLFSGKHEYVYDTNGNMITFTIYDWNGGSWVYYLSSSYTYDLSLLTDNIAYPFSRNEFISEFEKIYYNPISTSSYDGYYTYHYSPIAVTGIINLNVNLREVKNVIDFLGRKTKPQPNTPFIEIYDDGTVEKRIVIE